MEGELARWLVGSGPWGLVVLVLIRVVVYLYRRNETLLERHIAMSEKMTQKTQELVTAALRQRRRRGTTLAQGAPIIQATNPNRPMLPRKLEGRLAPHDVKRARLYAQIEAAADELDDDELTPPPK